MSTPITLVPGTLGYSCFPNDPQQLNVDIITLARAFLNENFPGIYVGDTEPPADQRDRIWFNTVSQKLYQYISGAWQRTYEVPADADVEWIWKGAENDLITFAGGSAGAVGPSTGPLWEVDHLIDGRVLIGPGTIPTADPVATVAIGATQDSLGNAGEAKHTLTDLEGAVAQHEHAFGLTNPGNDDAFFRKKGAAGTVVGFNGYYITGSNGNIETPQTTADLFTMPAGSDAKGVTAVGHNNMMPFIGRFVIKRTSRVYVPAPY